MIIAGILLTHFINMCQNMWLRLLEEKSPLAFLRSFLHKGNRLWDLVSITIIIIGVFVVGILLESPWSGYPKGDDGTKWVSLAQFTSLGFPDIMWDHKWFLGYNPHLTNSPLFSLSIMLISYITGLPVLESFHTIFFLSVLGTGLVVFGLTRALKIPRVFGVALAFLLWSTPAYWNYSIWGGAYDRVMAIPIAFWMLFVAIKHIYSINEDKSKSYWLILAVLSYSLGLLSNTIVIFFPFLLVGLLYVSFLRRIRPNLRELLLTLLVPFGLTAWFRIPFITAFFGLKYLNDPAPVDVLHFFLPGNTWVAALNPAYILLIVFSLFLMYRSRQVTRTMGRSMIVMLALVLIMAYTVAAGWTEPPSSIRLYSAYDNPALFSIVMIIFVAFVLAKGISNLGKRFALTAALFVIIISSSFFYVLGYHFNTAAYVVSWQSFNDGLRAGINQVGEPQKEYRLAANQRAITRWYNYDFHDGQVTGGRGYSPNPLAQSYFDTRVMFKSDPDTIGLNYIEDQPLRTQRDYGGRENVYPSLWWLDWYAANKVVLLPQMNLQAKTTERYSSSQYFLPLYSDSYMSVFKAEGISTISSLTNAPRVGFSGSEDSYFAFLDVLSYLNLDSRYLIPIFLQKSMKLDPASLDFLVIESYDEHIIKKILEKNKNLKILVFSNINNIKERDTNVFLLNGTLAEIQKQGAYGTYNLLQYILPDRLHAADIDGGAVQGGGEWNRIDFAPSISYAVNATGGVQTNGKRLLSISAEGAGHHQVNYAFDLQQISASAQFTKIKATLLASEDIAVGISVVDAHGNYMSRDYSVIGGNATDIQLHLAEMIKHGTIGSPKQLVISVNAKTDQIATVDVKDLMIYSVKGTINVAQHSVKEIGGLVLSSVAPDTYVQVSLARQGQEVAYFDGKSLSTKSDLIIPFGAFISKDYGNFDSVVVTLTDLKGEYVMPNKMRIFSLEPFDSDFVDGDWIANSRYEIPQIDSDKRTLIIRNTNLHINSESVIYYAGPGVIATDNPRANFSYNILDPFLTTGSIISLISLSLFIYALGRRYAKK